MSAISHHSPIPKAAGIGLRSAHIAEMLTRRPSAGWLEVHAENYMGNSAAVAALETLRETYPLSVHGVGLSLGSAGGLDRDHLERLRKVCRASSPTWSPNTSPGASPTAPISTTFCRSATTRHALAIVARNVDASAGDAEAPGADREPLGLCRVRRLDHDRGRVPRRRWSSAPVAACCSTSTTSMSRPTISASTPAASSTRCRPSAIGEIHLAGHAVNAGRRRYRADRRSRLARAAGGLVALRRAIEKFGAARR